MTRTSSEKREENREREGGSCEREEKEGRETRKREEGRNNEQAAGGVAACMNYGNTYSKLVHSE